MTSGGVKLYLTGARIRQAKDVTYLPTSLPRKKGIVRDVLQDINTYLGT